MILMVPLTGGAAQIIGEGVDSSRGDEVLTDVSRDNMIAQSVDVVTAEEGAASFSVVDGNEVGRCPTGRKRELAEEEIQQVHASLPEFTCEATGS